MNAVLKTLRRAAPKPRFCSKCNRTATTSEIVCSQCNAKLETVNRIRATGAISVLLGAALLVVMSQLSLWVYEGVAQSRFASDSQDLNLIVFVFALIAAIALFSIIAGLWQLIFGTRRKLIKFAALIFGAVIIGTSLLLSLSNRL